MSTTGGRRWAVGGSDYERRQQQGEARRRNMKYGSEANEG